MAKQRLEFSWSQAGISSISWVNDIDIHYRLTTLRHIKNNPRFSATPRLARGVKLKYEYLSIQCVCKLTVMNVFYIYWMPTWRTATILPWTLCLCVCVWVSVCMRGCKCLTSTYAYTKICTIPTGQGHLIKAFSFKRTLS